MSIDHSSTQPTSSQSNSAVVEPALPKRGKQTSPRQTLDWASLIVGKSKSPAKVFGESAQGGGVYLWGMAVAKLASPLCFDEQNLVLQQWGEEQDSQYDRTLLKSLSQLACDQKQKQKVSSIDWTAAAQQAIRQFESLKDPTADEAAMAVVWAAAIPKLTTHLDDSVLADLTDALLELRESVLLRSDIRSISHLILGGELGLTLAWRMPGLRSRTVILQSASDAVADWAELDEESISAAVAGATSARLTLASLIRCRCLMKAVAKRKFTKQNVEVAQSLATWVAAMTGQRGVSAFSDANSKDVKDDCGTDGLLAAAKSLDLETIGLAIDAAMGKGHSGGRLAWEVSLPDSMWCDESSKIAILLPQWDASRGRTHLDFSGSEVAVEIFAGQTAMIAGRLKSSLEIDGKQQQPTSDWEEICRYTDDDVHYLELEQSWSSDYLIQRQFLLIREDRCLMFADAVIPKKADADRSGLSAKTSQAGRLGKIQYQVSLPLAQEAAAMEEQETREVILRSAGLKAGGKLNGNQAMMLPLSASEWKIGPTSSKLILSGPDRIVFQASGHQRLYAPLWIDFSRRRLKRMRTWRSLTVCDSLELVPPKEAAAFRIQVGAEQWAIYRSLNDQRCRSFLGKHIMADFYVSRFDTGDGTHDALITVDDAQEDRT